MSRDGEVVEPLPFGLDDRSAEQLRFLKRALALLTSVRMARRGRLSPEGQSLAWDATGEYLTSVADVGRLLAAQAELVDRLLQSASPDEVVDDWLSLFGRALAVAEGIAAVSEQAQR